MKPSDLERRREQDRPMPDIKAFSLARPRPKHSGRTACRQTRPSCQVVLQIPHREFAIECDHRTQQRSPIRLFLLRVESGSGASVTHDHMKAQGDLDLAFTTFLFKLKDTSDLSCDGECSWHTLVVARSYPTEASPWTSLHEISILPWYKG